MKRFTPVIIAIAGLALTACQNSETPSDIRNQLVSESNALEKLATEDQRARLSEPEITPVEAPAETLFTPRCSSNSAKRGPASPTV